jgi:DNA-directed RNA polymerase subunit beta
MSNLNQDIYRCLLPNLLEIQRVSFCWFLEKGLLQELKNFNSIQDYFGELELSLSTKQYKLKRPKYSWADAKHKDTSYSIRVYVAAKLDYLTSTKFNKEKISLGDIPLMSNEGTFFS